MTHPIDLSLLAGKKVLVTGGVGFLGSRLCARLLKEGAEVIAFDNLLTGKRDNVGDLQANKKFELIIGDCNNRDDVVRVFEHKRPDYVFHYAAMVGVKRTVEHPLGVFQDLQGIKHVYECAVLSGVQKIIFASSSEAYGEPVHLPEREDGIWNAKNPYALVKLIGEQLGIAMAQEHTLRFTALRFFNVYGPGQEASDYGFVVGIFLRQILQGKAPTIFGDGAQTRDFVFVEDNLEVGLRALLSTECDGEVINVGSGRQTTIKELAEEIIRLSGQTLTPQFLPARTEGEIRHRCPDVAKCRTLIGYVPETTLEQGLRTTYQWYQSRYAV